QRFHLKKHKIWDRRICLKIQKNSGTYHRAINFSRFFILIVLLFLLFQPLCIIFVCISELAWFNVVSVAERNKSRRLARRRSSRDETGFFLWHAKGNGI